MSIPLPDNETARLRALRAFAVLDTPPERAFDDLTALAAQVCKRPIALVSLVDADRQWFKSRRGLDVAETPRDVAFCAHAILHPTEVMVVPDTQRDERFVDNPLVAGAPHLRFYAGAPLVTASGEALGTLCVLDREPGDMSAEEIEALQALARGAMALLEQRQGESALLRTELQKARHQIKALEAGLMRQEDLQKALSREHSFREALIEHAAEGVCVCHGSLEYPFVQFTVWNQRMTEITGYTMADINRLGWYQTLYSDPEDQRRAIERMERMRAGDDMRHERWEIRRADGSRCVLGISTSILTSAEGVEHVLAVMHDSTEEESLKQEAMLGRNDALTGVMGRRAFREGAEVVFRLAARTGEPCALGFIDLDDLKNVNDTMGHGEGDRVLERVGATLTASTRAADVVGRLGGDEFAVLLPNTGSASARILFDRLHRQLQGVMREHGWAVGFSAGVAVLACAPLNIGDALKHADNLMYQAKRSGKNRVVYAEFPGAERSATRSADR
ncbi:MAG: diguanylate cyclase [Gammaproteobacteria bacterium]|nr:diguanylate cyclase [Gammaproteobacteria bacterium]